MSDEITQREWAVLVGKLDETSVDVKKLTTEVGAVSTSLATLLERGVHYDVRMSAVERKADEALRTAHKCHSRLDVHEDRIQGNGKSLDSWQQNAIKLAVTLLIAAVVFAAGKLT